MFDLFKRSIYQVKRYWGRNLTVIIGLTLMVIAATILLNFTLQMNALFKQENLELLKQFQYLNISNNGREISNQTIEQIQNIDGVEKILPVTNGMNNYPWMNEITLEHYKVLPIYITYYDPTYAEDFFSQDLMIDYSNDLGAIVSSDFRKNMMTATQFQSIFHSDGENFSDEISRNMRKYQEQDFPMANEIKDLNLVGKDLKIRVNHEFDKDSNAQDITLTITGEFKPDYLFSLKNLIYLSNPIKSPTQKPKYDGLYIKTSTLEATPLVIEELQRIGFITGNNLEPLRKFLNEQKQFLVNIMIILGLILIIAVFSFINTIQSIIQERKNEIALMKALGATSSQIVFGIVLEGIMMALFSLFIGLLVVTILLKVLSYMIGNGAISPNYFTAFRLDKESVLFLLNVPFSIYLSVSLGTLLLGFIVSYIPSRTFFQKNYLSLLKRG